MSGKDLKYLEHRSRKSWRRWLEKNHASESGVWLVFHKGKEKDTSFSYDDAVEEALCFGWIDSILKKLDDDRYARKFTPRKSGSRWSTRNRRRYEDLKSRGLLAPAGIQRAPTDRDGDAPRPSLEELPEDFESRLKGNKRALGFFLTLAPSSKRACIGWIESAKKPETRRKRIKDALALLAEAKKLGLK
jgi:uncharacterized protein YdeI (YjbR/CyaY-like superfamily)